MQLPEAAIKKLDLATAAEAVCSGRLDRFPQLIMDRCVENARSTLVETVLTSARAGYLPRTETLTMPRRGFGPRPITITSPGVRVLYSAMVQYLSAELPAGARGSEAFSRHSAFGVPSQNSLPDEYLVETDIASCYEFIDHDQLGSEITSRTMNVDVARGIVLLLGELFGRKRGIPQLIRTSDVLADTYLEIMERNLLRLGTRFSRYADDFRILAGDWAAANEAIENAAEAAREIGLILSTEKTSIRKVATVAAALNEEAEFLRRYFDEARDETAISDWIDDLYDGVGQLSDDIDGAATIRIALHRLLEDWKEDELENQRHFRRFLSLALSVLQSSENRIPDELLSDIVFRFPLLLENVAAYVSFREEHEDNWATIARLAQMSRQSPWAKVWLAHLATGQPPETATRWIEDVDGWAFRQLSDRHEVVRAEVAWYIACRGRLSDEHLSRLYRDASSLTRPTLAAACGRATLSSSSLVKAIQQESKLIREAFAWGEAQNVDR